MCTDCGCGERSTGSHNHDHPHDDAPQHDRDRTISIRRRILQHNDDLATQLRAEFARQNVYVINVVSSPGSGKTELLQRTLTELQPDVRVAAVTGDLATENDANRLGMAGAPVRQILTGTMCHLEADMVADAIADWDLAEIDMLFIENVGNMVCPSGFDLGEDLRVMLVATTEGEDKPLKYPTLTLTADIAIISKIDLASAAALAELAADQSVVGRRHHPVRRVALNVLGAARPAAVMQEAALQFIYQGVSSADARLFTRSRVKRSRLQR